MGKRTMFGFLIGFLFQLWERKAENLYHVPAKETVQNAVVDKLMWIATCHANVHVLSYIYSVKVHSMYQQHNYLLLYMLYIWDSDIASNV